MLYNCPPLSQTVLVQRELPSSLLELVEGCTTEIRTFEKAIEALLRHPEVPRHRGVALVLHPQDLNLRT